MGARIHSSIGYIAEAVRKVATNFDGAKLSLKLVSDRPEKKFVLLVDS